MLTAEERERFETVLLKAHRCLSYSMEALVLIDALEALPEERRVLHLAYLLQNFWNYPDVKNEKINRTKPSWGKSYNKIANNLTERLAERLNPAIKRRPPVEEMAREINAALRSYPRPQRDVALSIVIRTLVPYGRVPEPSEFTVTPEECVELNRANKVAAAAAQAIAEAVSNPAYPKHYGYFAGAILSLIARRAPKVQGALLALFLGNLTDRVRKQRHKAAGEPPSSTPPPSPNDPSKKPN